MIKRNVICLILIVTCCILNGSTVTFAETKNPVIYNDQKSEITLYGDIIDWRYTWIDGNLYKRLYNYTSQTWIGEWIRA